MFPDFNIRSTPLLILIIQGLIFGLLLVFRYRQKGRRHDLFLSLLLFLTCYHCIQYTIGFMAWYNEYPSTKVNYFLHNLGFLFGPLVYFYVLSLTRQSPSFRRKDYLHFLPFLLFFCYRAFVWFYDSAQAGFGDSQHGYWESNIDHVYIERWWTYLGYLSPIIYLPASLIAYFRYRKRILQFFSNTYRVELTWILAFLLIYSIVFLLKFSIGIIDEFITPLHYVQEWWGFLISAIAVYFIGMKGYFTDLSPLLKVDFEKAEAQVPEKENMESELQRLRDFVAANKPYLNPELTLGELSRQFDLPEAQLSRLINKGMEVNFNDFINEMRVEEVKRQLKENLQQRFSVLGVGLESGFNSKATFYRVFKKFTGESPTGYLNSLKK